MFWGWPGGGRLIASTRMRLCVGGRDVPRYGGSGANAGGDAFGAIRYYFCSGVLI